MATTLNGIDITRLMSQIETVRQNPALGDFTFTSNTTWQGGFKGTHSLTDLRFGGEKKHHQTTHSVVSDLPECIAGEDTGPCPLEMLIASLGACLLTGYVTHATAMNIHLQEISIEISGEGDLSGFFGVGLGKSGITHINVQTRIKSTSPVERLQDLHRFVASHSPVWDTLTGRVVIESKLVTNEYAMGEVNM